MSTRRAFLRSVGVGAAALPLVPLLPSHAGTRASPRRLLFVHFGHGVAQDRWTPPGSADQLELSPILTPLAPFVDRLVVVEGLANAVARDQIGDVHNLGVGTLLTATALASDHGAGGHYLPGGISIDRRIGEALASAPDGPPHATLNFGVRSQGFAISAADRDVPLRAEDDPRVQYERVFGELALPPEVRQQRIGERADIRAFVRRRLATLAPTLPSADRETLERHRIAVETLEARSLSVHAPPPTCGLPSVPDPIGDAVDPANEDIPALIESTSALVTAALACDLTRVATIQWGSSGNDGLRHVWQGIDEDYHSIAHLANGEDPVAHDRLAAMNTWYAEQVAALLARMDAIDEGDGTLLDHTVVVFLSSFSIVHDLTALPIAIVGGGIEGNRRLQYDGQSQSGLWISLAQHLGVPEIESFGDPDYDEGPLTGLV